MIFNALRLKVPIHDSDFDRIYPERIKTLSALHWTPIDVALRASQFLAPKPNFRVLDIGSGAGKFCFVGATSTEAFYTGVEQRKSLVEISKRVCHFHCVENIEFVHSNIVDIDFRKYDSFYFFNSFYENLAPWGTIDKRVDLNSTLYHKYCRHIKQAFKALPSGTRIATYCGSEDVIPNGYELMGVEVKGLLHFWKKTEQEKTVFSYATA
jgi:predicted RNA methylase